MVDRQWPTADHAPLLSTDSRVMSGVSESYHPWVNADNNTTF